MKILYATISKSMFLKVVKEMNVNRSRLIHIFKKDSIGLSK